MVAGTLSKFNLGWVKIRKIIDAFFSNQNISHYINNNVYCLQRPDEAFNDFPNGIQPTTA